MGAGQAAAILQRRATPEERAAFEADYAEPPAQPVHRRRAGLRRRGDRAERDPAGDRRALRMLATKREDLRPRKHDNTPL